MPEPSWVTGKSLASHWASHWASHGQVTGEGGTLPMRVCGTGSSVLRMLSQ